MAGTGSLGYVGDGNAASAAKLARPAGIAYDSVGDLFVADANNHVIREVSAAGVITTVAGTGVAGFGGDGGPATAAFLDTPTGVAIDTQGVIYIADSHNHRVRKVSNGTITTEVGTGVTGFSGDGGVGTSAQLALPSGVALDQGGDLYIADTNNQRIRKLSNGILSTVAGNGEELFAGDGGAATAASLDQPMGVAVDGSSKLYIADKNNHRIRVVSAAGTISTVAGDGTGAFSGSFAGDGAAATSASLAKPVSVSADAFGNIYVADTNNQRVRQISANGTIVTIAGTGEEGFFGDGGTALTAILSGPRALASDGTGNLSIADTRNQRVRTAALGKLSFGSQAAGTTSAPQTLTLANTGNGPLTVASIVFSGVFLATSDASCPALPITLSPGASCTETVAFAPIVAGLAAGTVTIGGPGISSQIVLLTGTATTGNTTLLVASSKADLLSGEAVAFTATLTSGGGTATSAPGSVSFYAGSQLLGTTALSQGKAILNTSALADGAQTITATYSGGAGFATSASSAVVENVADLSLALTSLQMTTVVPGHSAPVPLSLVATSVTGLTGNVAFSAANVPAGMSVTFAPATIALSNGQLPFTMTVTAAPTETAHTGKLPPLAGPGATLALMLIPVYRKRRSHSVPTLRPLALLLLCVGGPLSLGTLIGCGNHTGFFGQKPQTYNVTVSATATDGTGGVLTRSTTVQVIVQ